MLPALASALPAIAGAVGSLGGGGGGGDMTVYQPSQTIGTLSADRGPLYQGMQINAEKPLDNEKLILYGAFALLAFALWKKFRG